MKTYLVTIKHIEEETRRVVANNCAQAQLAAELGEGKLVSTETAPEETIYIVEEEEAGERP